MASNTRASRRSSSADSRVTEVTVVLGDPRLPDTTKVNARYSPEDLEAVDRMKAALEKLANFRFTYLDNHATLIEELAARRPGLVLNLCDTGFRNQAALELHVPALLELLGIPYSGSPPGCLSRCYDKGLVRALAASHGVPVPKERYLSASTGNPDPGDVYPALIKPNAADGSVGISDQSVVRGPAEARAQINRLRAALPGTDFLVQEFLADAEYSIGLIGNPEVGFLPLPPLEVDYSGLDAGLPKILPYASKTVPESPYWKQVRYRMAELPQRQVDPMVQQAMVLFQRLGCRDYARIDFRTGADGVPRLLEVNPNPAWCWDGKLNIMAGFAGLDETGFFGQILQASLRRVATSIQT